MYTLMTYLGHELLEVMYPDTLVEAMNMAHDFETANNFHLVGNELNMRGVVFDKTIRWKQEGKRGVTV